jgi:hypothetical protein
MSCPNYKHYQNAVDSIRDALISALNNDEETENLEDIWSYYIGMRTITDGAFSHMYNDEDSGSVNNFWMDDGHSVTGNPGTASSDTISFNFNADTISSGTTGDTVLGMTYAAAPVDMGGLCQDTITFT